MKNQRKWLIGIIVLLLLMNVTVLGFFWLGKRPPSPKKISNHFIKELNLSASQKTTFETLFETHFEKSSATMDSIRICKEKMLETLVQADRDKVELNKIIKKIGFLESDKDRLLVEHFIALESACESEEQREQLRGIFKKSLPKHRHRPK